MAVKLAYLDQSHLTRIAKDSLGLKRDPACAGLREVIDAAVTARQLLCPYSIYHLMETTIYDNDPVRDEICAILGRWSRGHCFNHFEDRIVREMCLQVEVGVVQREASSFTGVGLGVACLPSVGLPHALMNAIPAKRMPQQRVFGMLVEYGRRNPQFRAIVNQFRAELLSFEMTGAAARQARLRPLAETRRSELLGCVRGGAFARWISSAASKSVLPDAVVRDLISAAVWSVPTLATMIEIRARRDIAYGRKPQIGDAIDAGHLSILPYTHFMLTERHFATYGRGVAAHLGYAAEVLTAPDQLAARLRNL